MRGSVAAASWRIVASHAGDTWRAVYTVRFQDAEEGKTEMKTKSLKKDKPRALVIEGSGNVFSDLGLPNPERELMKTRLTLQIYRIIRQRGMTQTEAAKVLGIKQPHVSLLMRNRSGSFSIGRLIEFLAALGQDVEITVRTSRNQHGELSVTVSAPAKAAS